MTETIKPKTEYDKMSVRDLVTKLKELNLKWDLTVANYKGYNPGDYHSILELKHDINTIKDLIVTKQLFE